MDKQLHIALVTAWYPPRISVAVNRMDAFAHFLNLNGFNVSVITLKENSADLSFEVLNGISIYRLTNNVIFKRPKFYAGEAKWKHLIKVVWNLASARIDPLPESGWMKAVSAQLSKLHQENKIDLVISSFSPVEAHLATIRFLDKNKEVKWIADMRDEMSMNKLLPSLTRRKLEQFEKVIGEKADAITSVSAPILDQFRLLMPNVKYFEEIRNGFNHDLNFENNFNQTFTIVYAGTFYGQIKPTTFFEGLKVALKQLDFDFEICFVGAHRNFQIPQEFLNKCKFIPKVSQLKSINYMGNADANLLILPADERKGVYSGKLFDYLSVKKAIIAVVDPNDVAAQLIRQLNAGYVADFNNPNEIATAILAAYSLWKNKASLDLDNEQFALLHRKHQVKKLELLIHKILKR